MHGPGGAAGMQEWAALRGLHPGSCIFCWSGPLAGVGGLEGPAMAVGVAADLPFDEHVLAYTHCVHDMGQGGHDKVPAYT